MGAGGAEGSRGKGRKGGGPARQKRNKERELVAFRNEAPRRLVRGCFRAWVVYKAPSAEEGVGGGGEESGAGGEEGAGFVGGQ